eukprot:586692-Rhodomonas_salina.1
MKCLVLTSVYLYQEATLDHLKREAEVRTLPPHVPATSCPVLAYGSLPTQCLTYGPTPCPVLS